MTVWQHSVDCQACSFQSPPLPTTPGALHGGSQETSQWFDLEPGTQVIGIKLIRFSMLNGHHSNSQMLNVLREDNQAQDY
jgi:hypothetical protein